MTVTISSPALFTSKTAEWYSPRHIVEAARAVMGGIELDPASCAEANQTVRAARFYSFEDDGLLLPWFGRVYLNPPYGNELPPWVERLVQSYEAGHIEQAVALLPARTDTAWFQPLFAYLLCFVRGRLRFSNAPNSAPFPSAVVYLGRNGGRFAEHFGAIGPIQCPYRGA